MPAGEGEKVLKSGEHVGCTGFALFAKSKFVHFFLLASLFPSSNRGGIIANSLRTKNHEEIFGFNYNWRANSKCNGNRTDYAYAEMRKCCLKGGPFAMESPGCKEPSASGFIRTDRSETNPDKEIELSSKFTSQNWETARRASLRIERLIEKGTLQCKQRAPGDALPLANAAGSTGVLYVLLSHCFFGMANSFLIPQNTTTNITSSKPVRY